MEHKGDFWNHLHSDNRTQNVKRDRFALLEYRAAAVGAKTELRNLLFTFYGKSEGDDWAIIQSFRIFFSFWRLQQCIPFIRVVTSHLPSP